MVKRVTLSEETVKLVEERRFEGESFSAAALRLIELGARSPRYIGSGEGAPDLSERVEEILRELALDR